MSSFTIMALLTSHMPESAILLPPKAATKSPFELCIPRCAIMTTLPLPLFEKMLQLETLTQRLEGLVHWSRLRHCSRKIRMTKLLPRQPKGHVLPCCRCLAGLVLSIGFVVLDSPDPHTRYDGPPMRLASYLSNHKEKDD